MCLFSYFPRKKIHGQVAATNAERIGGRSTGA
jgi:hypothetical protein